MQESPAPKDVGDGGRRPGRIHEESRAVPSSPPWPAVRREDRAWSTNPDQRGPNGSRPNRADRLLDRITVEIPAEIAELPVELSPGTVAACEDARAEIAALEQAGGLAGLGDLLARTESVASSRIERVTTDLDELARATLGQESSEAARQIMGAVRALSLLTSSCDGAASVGQEAILRAHRDLLASDPLEGRSAGRYRTQQNWVGGGDFTPRGSVHVPPPHQEVGRLMEDLVRFANRDDISAVAQAGIVHGQFEAIHPFNDGNGRVGRGLISACLRRRGVTTRTVVPVAAAMLADVDTYFEHLVAYRDGHADALVRYIARSTSSAAAASLDSARRLGELPGQWGDRVKARRGSAVHNVLPYLTENPVLDIARVEHLSGATRARAYDAIDRLADAGVLHEITGGSRNRIWVVIDVMDELSELEERIGTRVKPSSGWR